MDQSRAALAAVVTLIPLAMVATVNSRRPAQQNGEEEHEKKITVVRLFYPLYEFASRVVGDMGEEVSSLAPAGVETHDWEEPTPEDVSRMYLADVLVINGAGFER